MKHIFILFSIVLTYSCTKKSHEAIISSSQLTEEKRQYSFPDDWLGYWEGELNIYNSTGKTMTVPMALDNSKTDRDSVWTWAIIYGEDTISGRRDYELNVVDASKGHYVVDEKNSIFLDAFLLDNNLISTFKVAGNVLQSSYELDGEDMIFTIHMYGEEEIRTTGDTLYNGEEIPAVYSYKNAIYQKARLKKVR